MFAIPFRVSETSYSIVVALEKDNLARLQKYDPAELQVSLMGGDWASLTLKDIIITFATPEDQKRVMVLCQNGEPLEALRWLTRGWAYRPEAGDHDGPYLSVMSGKPGEKPQ